MRAAALLLALVAVAPLALADWAQPGHDAARTGRSADAGPAWNDTAWRAQLGGTRTGQPLVVDDHAYVATRDNGYHDLTDDALWRIALADGKVERLVRLEARPVTLGGDGERLYVPSRSGVVAYDLDGGEAWAWRHQPAPGDDPILDCERPGVAGGTLFLPCTLGVPDVRSRAVVFALDARAGTLQWTWRRALTDGADLARSVAPPEATFSESAGLAVLGPFVVVVTPVWSGAQVEDVSVSPSRVSVTGLDASTGLPSWTLDEDMQERAVRTPSTLVDAFPSYAPEPTGTPNVAYVKLGREVLALNPAQGSVVWRMGVGAEDVSEQGSISGFALDGRWLYVATLQTLYKIDTTTQQRAWTATLDPTANELMNSALMVAEDKVYLRSFVNEGEDSNNVFTAFSTDDGRLLWRERFDTRWPDHPRVFPFDATVANGAMVVAGGDGTVTLLGSAPVALRVEARADELYPAPGERVVVDLARTLAGREGPATSFRAEWGDGTATAWQTSPRFEHAFAAKTPTVARFYARNDAGQTASATLAFRVGETAPNLVSVAFSPENQETTFFVIGALLTAGAGAFGIVRVQRQRRRAASELAALDDVAARYASNTVELERALRERQRNARALLLHRGLSEGQFSLIESRVAELLSTARMRALDDRVHLLPHGMVLRLQEMLRDGRVNAWERSELLAILERDRIMTPDQKREVAALIEEWSARDRHR